MKKTEPKISICIPTFNRADLIGETLQCVVNQTQKPDQVVVIDNASTDQTEKIVRPFIKYGITYHRNTMNLGMAGNYNKCVELASNEYFTFLPSDDLIAPTWYEEWVKEISRHKADLYISPLTIMDSRHRLLYYFPFFSTSLMIRQPHVMKTLIERYAPVIVPNGATIFKKSVMQRIGHFDPSEESECDVRVSMRLLSQCDVYYFHKSLFVFREHTTRSFVEVKTDRNTHFFIRFERYLAIIKDINNELYQNNARFFLWGNLFMNLANINLYIVRGEVKKIIRSFQLVLKYFPDLFHQPKDWIVFFRYQAEFLKRAFIMGKIPPGVKKECSWLDNL